MSIAPVSLGTISDVIPSSITVPPVDYTSRDYVSLVNDMLNLIPSYLPEWTDRSPGDFGVVMIELFAYMGDILNYYSDRIANESFIATAQQRQSVLNLATLLDYTPHNNVAAKTQLHFTIANGTGPSGPVHIPIGTAVSTAGSGTNAVVFQTSQELWLFGDGVSNSANPTTQPGTGQPNQQIILIATDPITGMPLYYFNGGNANQTVTVSGTTGAWTLAPGNSFATNPSGPADQVFIVVNGNTIQFGTGNGTTGSGLMPPSGSTISVVYQPAAPHNYDGLVSANHGASHLGEGIGISDGTPSQSFALYSTPVVDGSVVIHVDEGKGPQPWQYYPRIVDAYANDPAYTLSTDANGVVTVTFGDNIAGIVPTPGAYITVDYVVGGGSVGNVAANTLTQLVNEPNTVSGVTNPNPASGGADIETTDHIRIHAPLSITAINRAVTLDDYAALTLNQASIAKAAAASTAYNAVELYIHPAGDFFGYGNDPTTTVAALTSAVNLLSPTLTNSAYTGYLDDKKMVTTSVVVMPPQYYNHSTNILSTGYVPVNISATVQVLPQYHQSAIQAAVVAALQNLLLFSVVDFGYRLSLSQVYHAIMNVEGVDYVDVTALYRNDSTSGTGDIVCAAYEIPQAFQINSKTIVAQGGIPY